MTSALLASGFTVVGENTQNLEVEGPIGAVERMFSTHMERVRTPKGGLNLPPPIAT